ncbi:hypothetical protein [Phytohabitans houttuyneae]|uniref:DNA-binding protein n=1 Tax=Phytohabitans houttuyneae TaxID=1076126 RepID=A0A6V8KRS8_9ACTN|nr:hypothetical protein [Phytohabitans houttuyneae]GFJ84989.1 hypothetical protein Phou_091690 [Phytohabitans houttuyneae]
MEVYDFCLILASPPEQRRIAQVRGVEPHLTDQPDKRQVIARREAPSLAEAVVSVIQELEAVNLAPVRVCDNDWLTLADIATRIGKSREIVRLWSIGKQGPGAFPPPLNPGCDTRFYSWTEVSHWLRRRLGYQLPDPGPDLVVANLLLQARRQASRLLDPQALSVLLTSYMAASPTGVVQPRPYAVGDQSWPSRPAVRARAAA